MDTNADRIARLERIAAGLQQDFDKAERPPDGGYGNWWDEFVDYGDQDYQARIQEWDMFPGRKDPSALWLKMTASVQHHAELNGREIPIMFNIADREGLPYLKDHFWKLGVSELNLKDLRPGSDLLNGLLDAPILIGVYQGKGGGWWATLRQRLDGQQHSDLGTAQEQIAGFEDGTSGAAHSHSIAGPKTELGKIEEAIERDFKNKPANCICKDPTHGDFDEKCPVPGHGIDF